MESQSRTIDCGPCGTPVKRTARVCPGCHAQKGVGRLASGRVVGPEEIGRTRRFVAFFAAVAVICGVTGVWFGAIACGFVALAALVQSGSVVFSGGREYWFR
ncbi:hypothetical protein PY32053_01256 [Paracoccus yeei]|uniref:Uncharacterized protein n=1 Tax=Paracoccus yeei TaxID=147645 RepID=A0A386UK32_9RHOB|nr:hypothetical protein [Paracoccus yeei]AYF00901.1 hypothetical protein PY32053_01256 [Paracoccus yeei]